MSGIISAVWNALSGNTMQTRAKRRTHKHISYCRSLRIEGLEDRRMLATFMVNSMTDNGVGVTLRDAITDAVASTDAVDTIKFDETEFANGGTILLEQGELTINGSGHIIIDGTDSNGDPLGVTIDTNDSDGIDNGNGSRVFNINLFENTGATKEVKLIGLTITGGDTDKGGGISFEGTAQNPNSLTKLSIVDSIITGNHAEGLIDFTSDKYFGGGGVYAAMHGTTLALAA